VTHINKLVLPYLNMYPLPNGPAIPDTDMASYTFVGHRIVREDFFTTRVDHHFSQKDSVFATYMFDRTPFTSDEPLGVVLLGALTKRQIAAVEENAHFQSELLSIRCGSIQPRPGRQQQTCECNSSGGGGYFSRIDPGEICACLSVPQYRHLLWKVVWGARQPTFIAGIRIKYTTMRS